MCVITLCTRAALDARPLNCGVRWQPLTVRQTAIERTTNTSHTVTGSRVSRRRVLGGAAIATIAGLLRERSAFAQQLQTHRAPGIAPKPKGPLVFLDYDQQELDDAYTQALWAPNQVELERRNAQKSAQAIARLGSPRRLAYGPTRAERLELYLTKRPNAPINVFVHGGAWRAGTAASEAYQSEMFVDAGAH